MFGIKIALNKLKFLKITTKNDKSNLKKSKNIKQKENFILNGMTEKVVANYYIENIIHKMHRHMVVTIMINDGSLYRKLIMKNNTKNHFVLVSQIG